MGDLQRLEHAGAAVAVVLTAPVSSSATSFVLSDNTGWPTGATGPFFIRIDRGLASEEKILAQTQADNTVVVTTGGRGADGTTAQAHSAGAVVDVIWDAAEADDANRHIYVTADDDHTQYVRADGERTATTIVVQNITVGTNAVVGAELSAAVVVGNSVESTGLFGASAARLVGTTTGQPSGDDYDDGDFAIDRAGTIWIYNGAVSGWYPAGGYMFLASYASSGASTFTVNLPYPMPTDAYGIMVSDTNSDQAYSYVVQSQTTTSITFEVYLNAVPQAAHHGEITIMVGGLES